MQESSVDQPPSLSQLLRESYLAEARAHQRHSEMSRSDSSSSRRLVYGPLKGKADDPGGQDADPQFPDLSAFLSQEELDKSVNLARQAIGHESREERAEVKAALSPSATPPENPSATPPISPPAPPSTNFTAVSTPDTFVPSFAAPSTQPASDTEALPLAHTSSDERKMQKASTQQCNTISNSRAASESCNDFNRSARNAPYGVETQSKKEFLNKAADFIEELSSLFKANSSKRVRPRACKAHRSRAQNKSQSDETVTPVTLDDRERPSMPLEVEMDKPGPDGSYRPEAQLDPGSSYTEFPMQDCRITEEQQYNSPSEGVAEAESMALTDTPYSADPVCEPPRFIQKLKSREVPEGSKVQLDCIVRGLPLPEVRWFCEGKELENSPDIQIITNGENHSLVITEAFEEDTGRYSCFASNFYGTDSTSAEIYIEGASSTDSDGEQHFEHVPQLQRKATKPALSKPPAAGPAVSVAVEDPLSPLPTTEKEELPQELSSQAPSQDAPVPPLPVQTSTIVLPVLEPSQAPEVSTPHLPQVEPAAAPVPAPPPSLPEDIEPIDVLSVHLPDASIPEPEQSATTLNSLPTSPVSPLPESQNNHNYYKGIEGRPSMSAPVFTKSLQDLLAFEGQLVVLECRVKGVPSPRVDWYREGSLIDDSPDFRILQKKPRSPAETEEICTLVISEVFPEDSGMFTSTASNKYGTVSSIATLTVKGTGSNRNHMKTRNSSLVESSQVQAPYPSHLPAPVVKPQPEVTVTNSIKPRSSTILLDPLNTGTLRLEPHSSGMLCSDPLSASLPCLDPLNLSITSHVVHHSLSTPRLDPLYVSTLPETLPASSGRQPDPRVPSYLDPFSGSSAAETGPSKRSAEMDMSKPPPALPDLAAARHQRVTGTPSRHGDTPVVVPLPDPPANSCLKTGVLVKHKVPRSTSRVGLRVHFKLPEDEEDEESDASCQSGEDSFQTLANKEPPPVLTKPKLGPAQLQILHNQVLLEQQQDTDSPSHTQNQVQPKTQPQTRLQVQSQFHPNMETQGQPQIQFQIQPNVEAQVQSKPKTITQIQVQPLVQTQPLAQTQPQILAQTQPQALTQPQILVQTQPQALTQTQIQAMPQDQVQFHVLPHVETQVQTQPPTQIPPDTMIWSPRMQRGPQPVLPYLNTSISLQPPHPAPVPSGPPFAPPRTSAPTPLLKTAPPSFSSLPPAPQLRTAPPVTSPPPFPQLSTAPPSVTQTNTIHASHLNLAPLSRTMPASRFSSPAAPQFSTAAASTPPEPVTSPVAMLRSTHASLMNLAPSSQSFHYARPKEFIAAQSLSPVRGPSPTESPTPLLQELAAELNSSAASSPTLPPFSPPPRVFPTRVLRSPTSPPAQVSSPTLLSAPFLNSVFAVRTQSPPQASSPSSSSSTPSPIQNPVAFLSSVLPSLPTAPPTNSMGLPKGAPHGPQSVLKRLPRTHLLSNEDLRESKESLLYDIEKKLRFREDSTRFGHQQKLINEGKTVSRPLGPNIPATVFNYDEEYKVSNFEQRLMSEIEFRLERTPVEESDDEVQHDEIPTGRCIAPIFEKKLKNFRAMEGVPVTFSCKVLGIPIPKVYWFKDGKQILRKNDHYKKIREGDGTCALHIDSTTSDDDGNYTIMAANPQGRISCSGHLIIQTGPPRNRMTPIHSQRVRARIQEVEEGEQTQERFFKPHFLQAPGDMLAHEGRLCRLDCKVSGLPIPELMWLVNGKPIYSDLYHKMLVRENGIHSLVIDPLKQSDAGTYTCIASNKAGQSSFCLELKVVEREMKQPPHFVEKLQNTGIPEGSSVRLECRVLGIPAPVIFWKKDNDTIPKRKDRCSMHQEATGYVCLLIQPSKKEDAGWYTVSAKNEAGIVSCTARLDIYAQWHQSIPMPMKKGPRTGSRYAALTGQGLDIKSAFPTSENSPTLFSSSPPEAMLESEEL